MQRARSEISLTLSKPRICRAVSAQSFYTHETLSLGLNGIRNGQKVSIIIAVIIWQRSNGMMASQMLLCASTMKVQQLSSFLERRRLQWPRHFLRRSEKELTSPCSGFSFCLGGQLKTSVIIIKADIDHLDLQLVFGV